MLDCWARALTLGMALWSGRMGTGRRIDSWDCWDDESVGMMRRWNSIRKLLFWGLGRDVKELGANTRGTTFLP